MLLLKKNERIFYYVRLIRETSKILQSIENNDQNYFIKPSSIIIAPKDGRG